MNVLGSLKPSQDSLKTYDYFFKVAQDSVQGRELTVADARDIYISAIVSSHLVIPVFIILDSLFYRNSQSVVEFINLNWRRGRSRFSRDTSSNILKHSISQVELQLRKNRIQLHKRSSRTTGYLSRVSLRLHHCKSFKISSCIELIRLDTHDYL